jgi:hypothetical protein
MTLRLQLTFTTLRRILKNRKLKYNHETKTTANINY